MGQFCPFNNTIKNAETFLICHNKQDGGASVFSEWAWGMQLNTI